MAAALSAELSELLQLAREVQAARPAPAAPRWGIVELLGHRRLYGLVGERELASGTFLTVQVPTLEVPASRPMRVHGTDQWRRYPARTLRGFAVTVGPASVYAITVLDGTPEEAEEAVRARMALDLPGILRDWPFPVPDAVPELCEAPADTVDPGEDGNEDMPF